MFLEMRLSFDFIKCHAFKLPIRTLFKSFNKLDWDSTVFGYFLCRCMRADQRRRIYSRKGNRQEFFSYEFSFEFALFVQRYIAGALIPPCFVPISRAMSYKINGRFHSFILL